MSSIESSRTAVVDRMSLALGPPAASVTKLLLRPEEAGDALGLSRARIYELIAAGALGSVTIGRSRRIPISDLEAFIGGLR